MTEKTGFFGSGFFSNVTSSVNALSQTIQTKGIPEMNKRFTELQQKARELPGQIALLQGDLESEHQLFLQKNKNVEMGAHRPSAKGAEPVAPWVGYNEYEKEMKQAIMDISKDERNFLLSPPEDTSFQFDLNAYSQSAQAALKEDTKLSHMRFLLVPQQVQEPTFWRNYFYRVTIVKQTVLSNPPPAVVDMDDEVSKKTETVLFDFKDDDQSEEEDVPGTFDYTSEEEDEDEKLKKPAVVVEKKAPSVVAMATEKEENYEGMEDWEIELRRAAI
ncbi:uncharacterized protein EV154DRAFT_570171 [Mucor mucedo]|uniref:uncharacterized protein n=1 Tax=Mucor mucedo TaxID=29922 RepID=UPI00221FDB7F|nr:uncharacterized protein EV154DRAFT_570171 [Mucor mucedo]KAI7873357.1 hypothetical protein EV154DRAFT_570171 [Mucor mucedo]